MEIIMPLSFKKIITALVLASFLAVVFLSFPMIMAGADGSMPGGCPFSDTGVSLCPQDTLAVAIHHISSYQSFLNVSVYSSITALAVFLIIAALIISAFFSGPPRDGNLALAGVISDSPPADPRGKKIIRWLSLLENSPSL